LQADYPHSWLTVHNASISKLLRPGFDTGKFDFIYSAGLYDYLPDNLGQALATALLDRLNPGGRLLLANFLDTTGGRAYMELVMDWKLLWRTPEQLRALYPEALRESVDLFVDPPGNVVYATYTKPA
jgi:extracellular factor (EF) 3-hydroxypalmitic acid methyl ester biosynthesis protein